MALSDLAVKQAEATGKAYTLPDIDGLSLAVTPAGNKSWHFRYYGGKPEADVAGQLPGLIFCRYTADPVATVLRAG